jgi:hypothetical protein
MDIVAAVAWVTLGFVALLGSAVVWQIFTGQIDLTRVISEPSGDASMSRLQLLIFTFVIALSLFLVIASSKELPDISPGVLTLLGISASSYLVSKGIQFSKPEGIEEKASTVTVIPSSVTLGPGQSHAFKAEVSRIRNKVVRWAVLAPGIGQIDPATGRYTAPAAIPAGGVAVTIQALSVADQESHGTATVLLVP